MNSLRPPFMLTVRQAAKTLGLRRSVIRQMITLGQLPTWRDGGRIYVDPMSVRAAFDRGGWFNGEG